MQALRSAADDEAELSWVLQRLIDARPVTIDGDEQAPLEHQGGVRTAAFSPDGTRVVTAGEDKAARLWGLPVNMGSFEDWRLLARCSPFALVNGVLTTNPDPLAVCPAH